MEKRSKSALVENKTEKPGADLAVLDKLRQFIVYSIPKQIDSTDFAITSENVPASDQGRLFRIWRKGYNLDYRADGVFSGSRVSFERHDDRLDALLQGRDYSVIG